jgi:hypothetical protein
VAGEIAEHDLWFPPIELPVGFGQTRTPTQLRRYRPGSEVHARRTAINPGQPNSTLSCATPGPAAATSSPAPAMIAEIADIMGRSRNGVRSRLARIGCDPDIPGRTLAADDPAAPITDAVSDLDP